MDGRVVAEIGLAVLALALWALALRDAWRAWQPTRLLLAGRYVEAQRAAERLERSWLRVLPGVRLSSRFAVGCARHLAGDLEGSLATLAPMHDDPRVRGPLRYGLCSVDAANRILLDRDHARALALLEQAAGLQRSAEDLLLAALARLATGDEAAAERLFDEAGTERARGGARLTGDRRQHEAIFHALRGLYLVKAGRAADAAADLAIAARSPVASTYVERARAALKPAPDADDPRSSLAPQVLAKETGER